MDNLLDQNNEQCDIILELYNVASLSKIKIFISHGTTLSNDQH